MVKICLECGKEFEPGGNNPNHAIYCSVYCGKKHRRKVKDAERLHKVICSECGTEFETTRANKSCCGPECVYKRQLRRSRENGKMYRVKYKEAKKEKKKSTVAIPLHEFEAEARKQNLSYGYLEMMRQMEKERANRLRGTA